MAKCNAKVRFFPDPSYAAARREVPSGFLLQENRCAPSERMLQLVWMHQRLQRDSLRLEDGQPLQVLHPGFLNHEPGPDFRQAMIRIGQHPAQLGDIEIDLHPHGWHGHGHDANPNFVGVILHAVWEPASTPVTSLPTVVLQDCLDSPLADLAEWITTEPSDRLPPEYLGQCCQPLQSLSESSLRALLRQAAWLRFQGKARRLQARAKQAGWEQALWEGLFRSLGYKHNVWPMHRLAELRRLFAGSIQNPVHGQALLLGIAGLLPRHWTQHSSTAHRYLRRLWDHWWREQDSLRNHTLPARVWHRAGIRPANLPERRLALAAHWLVQNDLLKNLESWGVSPDESPACVRSLGRLLMPGHDLFWRHHWSWRTAPTSEELPLLGQARLTDLAMNAILPWLWIRASEGQRTGLMAQLEKRYLAWPSAQDNALLRLARQRLLGRTGFPMPSGAAYQQGILQIIRDFCANSNALCHHCRFPDLARTWQAQTHGAEETNPDAPGA